MKGLGWIWIILLVLNVTFLLSQSKYDYNWIIGYNYTDSANGGFQDFAEGMIINFNVSPPQVSVHPIPFHMRSINVISHPVSGRLQYYTNGCRIINADHETMDGGDSLNFSKYYTYYCDIGIDGFHSDFNGMLSLPAPGQDNVYYLIHRPSEIEFPRFRKIWYSVIDMNRNEGKGKVIKKNVQLLNNLNLSGGYNTACRHSNGRDWWILAWERDKPTCYILKLDESGLTLHHTQMIGDRGPQAIGQAVFSPNGSTYMWYDLNRGVHVYDFDRTEGLLSNHRTLDINEPYEYGVGGVAISPNSRFAYLSARYKLYQLDLWEQQLSEGLTFVDSIDYVTRLGIPLDFTASMLGPDCKIYVSTGFAWYYYHIIHHPDEKGVACSLEKMALKFPFPNSNSAIPNVPHYRMDEAEVCNPRISSLFPLEWYQSNVLAYPNPTSDQINIECKEAFKITIRDMMGHEVFSTASQSPVIKIDISHLNNGLYFVICKTTSGKEYIKKIIKQ